MNIVEELVEFLLEFEFIVDTEDPGARDLEHRLSHVDFLSSNRVYALLFIHLNIERMIR
jgi:hypothetical protein